MGAALRITVSNVEEFCREGGYSWFLRLIDLPVLTIPVHMWTVLIVEEILNIFGKNGI